MDTKKIMLKILRWIIIAIIAVVLFRFGMVAYIFYKINTYQESSNLKQKFEPIPTDGPMPVTDVPVTLPPDPGEAGKKTLAGIDSNNDGVRDDLEREIVYMYPKNEEVRRVLRAMVKRGQDMITTTGDHDHFEALIVEYSAFWNCYTFLVFGNNLADHTNFRILNSMIQNTSQREKIFTENENKARPFVTEISDEACTRPLVKDQY